VVSHLEPPDDEAPLKTRPARPLGRATRHGTRLASDLSTFTFLYIEFPLVVVGDEMSTWCWPSYNSSQHDWEAPELASSSGSPGLSGSIGPTPRRSHVGRLQRIRKRHHDPPETSWFEKWIFMSSGTEVVPPPKNAPGFVLPTGPFLVPRAFSFPIPPLGLHRAPNRKLNATRIAKNAVDGLPASSTSIPRSTRRRGHLNGARPATPATDPSTPSPRGQRRPTGFPRPSAAPRSATNHDPQSISVLGTQVWHASKEHDIEQISDSSDVHCATCPST